MSAQPRPVKTRLSEQRLRMSIASFLDSFGNPVTRGTYERSLREFVRWFRKTNDFRFLVQDVERYKRYLTKGKKLSAVSVSAYLTSLRSLCSFLVEKNILKANPAKFVGGNSRPRVHVRKALSDDDVRKLLDTLGSESETGLRDAAIMLLMLDCGLSESELVHANVEDFRNTTLCVQSKGMKSKGEPVAVTSRVADAIERYSEFLTSLPAENRKPESPLFLSAGNRTRGMRMSTRGIRDVVNNHLHAAGIRRTERGGITPHSLRCTAARRLAESGATPEEIRQRLRLGTIQTAKIYLKANP
ncbi:MAG: tyrosine-type recombinase/integrase [Bacteroidetes bacterium]|nr:tyrosine-type recombinase/integrase [Bacteroidota bacterium]MCW5897093.1 tyrosine-type recombinase/integrase [Bacteroidota bacterium]